MRPTRIFCPQPLVEGLELELESRNNHYLIHVLRVKSGARLLLFDGVGNEFNAIVSEVSRKTVSLLIEERCIASRALESPLHTTLGIAVSKGERMDWVVQKATELGVTEIQPLLTRRVEVKLADARADKKIEHWRSVLVSACEQCGRSVVPQLHNPLKLQNWLAKFARGENNEPRLILQANGCSFDSFAANCVKAPVSASLLVGPEGGFEESETVAALAAGFVCVKMGERILRTETAPLVALSLLQQRWGDLA